MISRYHCPGRFCKWSWTDPSTLGISPWYVEQVLQAHLDAEHPVLRRIMQYRVWRFQRRFAR